MEMYREKEKKRDTEREHFRKLQKDKIKVYAGWDTQGRRLDQFVFISLQCGQNRPRWKTCALCAVIILPESQDRSSQCGLLTTVLHSLHFHSSSLWMHTQMHRWPFLAVSLKNETVGDTYRHIHAEAVWCLVQLKREYKTVKISWTWVIGCEALTRRVQMCTAICSDEKLNVLGCITATILAM